jgi:outer membrane protein assembly factor BamB
MKQDRTPLLVHPSSLILHPSEEPSMNDTKACCGCPLTRQWLSILGTIAVFGAVLAALVWHGPIDNSSSAKADDPRPDYFAVRDRDWPMFGGTITRNLVNLTDRDPPTTWDVTPGKEVNVKWSLDLGSKAYGGPIISGGKVFIGTNNEKPRNPAVKGDKGVMMCFDEKTGNFLWQIVHDKLAAGRVQDWPKEGICSSPVVEGNRIWYVSNRCEIVCADTDGKQQWKLDMIKDLKVFPHNLAVCSPLIVGDVLFAVTANGVDEGHVNIPAPDAPSFIAVNKKTGEVLWTDKSPGRKIMHGQWSNPVYAQVQGKPQVIFPGGDGFIYSFNPKNGEVNWKFDGNPKASVYILGPKGTRNDYLATPVIWDNKLYIGVGQDPEHDKGVGHLWCIDITRTPTNKDKDVSPWSDPNDPVQSNFDPKDPRNKDSALVWHFGGKAPANAKRPYNFGRTISTCCIHDGLVYAAEYEGYLHCFDAKTGQHYWEHDMGQDTWCSASWVDGKVYIGNEGGQVLIFAHGKDKKLLETVTVAQDGQVRATPIVANGVLYVMTENPTKLYAIQKKK